MDENITKLIKLQNDKSTDKKLVKQLYDKCPKYIYSDEFCYIKTNFEFDNSIEFWSNFVYEGIGLTVKNKELLVCSDTCNWLQFSDINTTCVSLETLNELVGVEYNRYATKRFTEKCLLQHRLNQMSDEIDEMAIGFGRSIGGKIRFDYEA